MSSLRTSKLFLARSTEFLLALATFGVIRPTRTVFTAVGESVSVRCPGLPQWCLSSFSSFPRTR